MATRQPAVATLSVHVRTRCCFVATTHIFVVVLSSALDFFCLLFVVLYFYIHVYSRRRSCECAATLEQFSLVRLGRALWTVFILVGVFCGMLWLVHFGSRYVACSIVSP